MDALTPGHRVHLASMEATFPGWALVVRDGWWWATKRVPPTPEQIAAGVLPDFARPGPFELLAALTVQQGILMSLGAA
ncbi:hypothetical protein C1I98_28595 [Spongiactinospora gelatinilytica]|uniref:Uncharacterized protein n=1 Tax=Spongiactinospora gelatinilytica TaxID=2666298 RepID=A0A2W2G8L3_9ACTN|nr:hypothetical protein [Spongiactinospora gelatinilytica]PZG33720.1 hypothetical protein C1I98_28595 [Spongiactinospora gelatinilytica]